MQRLGLVRDSTSPSPRQSKEVTHSADVSPTSARTTTAHSSTEDTPHSPAEANDSTAVLANLSPERQPTRLLTPGTAVPATGTTVPATSTAVLDNATAKEKSDRILQFEEIAPFAVATKTMITDCLPFPPGEEEDYEESEHGILDDDLLTICQTTTIHFTNFTTKQDKLFFSLKLEGLPVTAQLDSGATACLISDDIFQSIPNKEALAIHRQRLRLIDHNQREIVQTQYPRVVTFTMGSFSIQHPVYVISNGERNSFLAGCCLMRECQISILNFGMDNVKLALGNPQSPHTMLPTFNESSPVGQEKENVLVVETETVLKPLETTAVSCCTNSTAARDVIVRLHPSLEMSPLVIDESVQDLQARENTIAVTNRSLEHIVLPKKLDLATACNINDPMRGTNVKKVSDEADMNNLSEGEMEELLLGPPGLPLPEDAAKFDVEAYFRDPANFPPHMLDAFLDFIRNKTPGIFSSSDYDFGRYQGEPADIVTVTNTPVTVKPYHLDIIRQQQLDKILHHLTERGIMEMGTSPWCSPAFLVPRRGEAGGADKVRLVLDYRALNAVTMKDVYPLPRIPTLLNRLQNCDFFSSIDLRSAFYAVELTPNASLKAAIRTPTNVYLPKRLMMGLACAPNVFSQRINESLADLQDIAIFFIDDVLIMTTGTMEDHLRDVFTILQRLHKKGFKVNSKARFFQKEISFLGKTVTKNGMRPLPRHLAALRNFPAPESRRDLQRLMGLLAWLSSFIYDFANKTGPLNDILKLSTFRWTAKHQEIFEEIKNELTENTAMYFCNFNEPLYIATDICVSSFAAIAYQVTSYSAEDKEHLQEAARDVNNFPASTVPTNHPVLPPVGKGVPEHHPLQAEDVSKATPSYVVGKVDQPPADLTSIMGETDRVHVVKPVAFNSGRFTGAAFNYTALEKETCGLLLSLEAFRHYVACASVTYVVTDSQALVWLLRFRHSNISKLERYIIRLLSYNFKIIVAHLKGSLHPADKLTRVLKIPEQSLRLKDAKEAIVVETPFRLGQIVTPEEILAELERNPNLVSMPSVPAAPLEETSALPHLSVSSIQHLEQDLSIRASSMSTVMGELRKELSNASIASAQLKDPDLQRDIERLKAQQGDAKEATAPGTLRLRQGLLHRVSKDGHLCIVVPRDLQPFLIALFHMSAHAGGATLTRQIQQHYYFKNMLKITTYFTSRCALCVRFRPNMRHKELLGHAPLPVAKAAQWTMDVVVGLPSQDGFDGFITFLDVFSGYKLAWPCNKTIGARHVAKLIRTGIIQYFGIPEMLVSDGGANLLRSKELTELCNFYGIKQFIGSPYSAKSHGRVEAANRVISELTRMLADQYEVPWPRILPLAIATLNRKPRAYFGQLSPAEIMYGTTTNLVEPHAWFETELISPEEHKKLFCDLNKATEERIKVAEEEMKKQNRALGGIRTFLKPNSAVYVKDYRILPHRKFRAKFYSAPHLVLRDLGTTVLVKNFLGLTMVVHKDNVRPAWEREVHSFQQLPFRTRAILGEPFSWRDIERAVLDQRVPEFWKETNKPPRPPRTRQQTAQLDRDPAEEPLPPFYFPDEEEPRDTSAAETTPVTASIGEKTVRFE